MDEKPDFIALAKKFKSLSEFELSFELCDFYHKTRLDGELHGIKAMSDAIGKKVSK